MPLLLVAAIAIAIAYFSPRAANIIAGLITFGFIVPFYTFGGGTFIWTITTLCGLSIPYIICCFGGLIIGSLLAMAIYSE